MCQVSTTYCLPEYHVDLQISPDAFVTVTPVRVEVESARPSLLGPPGAMWMRTVAARTRGQVLQDNLFSGLKRHADVRRG